VAGLRRVQSEKTGMLYLRCTERFRRTTPVPVGEGADLKGRRDGDIQAGAVPNSDGNVGRFDAVRL